MSRNIGETVCYYCPSPRVDLVEEPRPITGEEAGGYFENYDGMIVANAECPACGAQYLAWVNEDATPAKHMRGIPFPVRTADPELGYFDLSFRAAFNDEPWITDLPIWVPDLVKGRSPAKLEDMSYARLGDADPQGHYEKAHEEWRERQRKAIAAEAEQS